MAVLKAYFDESENSKTQFFTLAGWVAPQITWDAFTPKWRQLLDSAPHPISAFHSTDIAHQRGEFSESRGWTRKQCDELVVEATNVLTEPGDATKSMRAVGCTVDMRYFQTLSVLPPRLLNRKDCSSRYRNR